MEEDKLLNTGKRVASGQRNISSERVRSSTSEWVARCAAACHGGVTLVTMATLRALAPANPRDLRDNWIDLDQSFDRSIYIFRLSVLVRSMTRDTTLTLLPSCFSKDIPFERELEREAKKSVHAISRFDSRSIDSSLGLPDRSQSLFFSCFYLHSLMNQEV